MGALRVLGTEAACGTSVGAASTFDGSTDVRLVNVGSTVRLVNVANASDATLGTLSLAGGETVIIKKKTTDQVFAAHAEIKGTAVLTEG